MSDPRGVLLDRMISEINDLRRRVEAQEAQEQTPRAQKARALDTQFPDALLHLPFDGGVPYETDYSVNLAGHKLQFPTVASGGIIGRPGKFGKAVQLAEGTTNYVRNPSFEVDTTTWTANNLLYARYNFRSAPYGQWSLALGGATGADPFMHSDVPIGAAIGGKTFTVSFYWRGASTSTTCNGNVQIGWGWANWQGIAPSGTAPGVAWVRRQLTFTVPAGVTETTFQLILRGGGATGDIDYDAIQVEEKGYASPYCDGSLGPGHAWTGTPYASTSTRAAQDLLYHKSGMTAYRGTVSFWVSSPIPSGQTANTSPGLFTWWDNWNTDGLYLEMTSNRNGMYFNSFGGGVNNGMIGASGLGWAANTWHHVVATWDYAANERKLYVDGQLAGEGTYANLPNIAETNFRLGTNFSGRDWNGWMDDLLILDRALTATEVKRLYEAGQAGLGVLCPPQWKVDDSGAADAHVMATDASGNARIGGGLQVGGLRMPMVGQTISGGAITVGPGDGYIRIDTEGAAPTDDLDTINGGSDGQIIVLRTQTSARSVVVKNNTGNITCGADVILSHPRDKLMLIYDAATPVWTPIAPLANNA